MVTRFDDGGDDEASLAPVIPLFGVREVAALPVLRDAGTWHTTWTAADGGGESGDAQDGEVAFAEDRDGAGHEIAERSLMRRLRTRSLSVAEARAVVREHTLAPDEVERMLQTFCDRRYLDDAALAEQLVHAGSERRGQGRRAIAQTLAARGIPRAIADAALDVLADDDAERALAFAQRKAASMRDLDRDTALRRLHGQLARRGYTGQVAMQAASRALDEQTGGSGVRFR